MKLIFLFLLALTLTLGCTGNKNDAVMTSSDFDHAMETIATSADWNSANAAAVQPDGCVLPAINVLREHLSDDRVISLDKPTRPLLGTVGEHAFWAIRDAIEPLRLPRRLDAYSALTRDNVEDWLGRHQGESLLELQVEAASHSLDLATRDFERNGNSDARDAMFFYSEHLSVIQPLHDVFYTDNAFSRLSVLAVSLKNVNYKVYGTMPSRSDLDRLHHRLNNDYEIGRYLHWDVQLRDTGQTVSGPDGDVYPRNEI